MIGEKRGKTSVTHLSTGTPPPGHSLSLRSGSVTSCHWETLSWALGTPLPQTPLGGELASATINLLGWVSFPLFGFQLFKISVNTVSCCVQCALFCPNF